MIRQALAVACAAALLVACAKKVNTRDGEKLVNERWKECIIVEPKKVTIEAQDGKKVRFSYVLRMRLDGTMAGKQAPCPVPAQKIIEVYANKDMAEIKQGTEIQVIE